MARQQAQRGGRKQGEGVRAGYKGGGKQAEGRWKTTGGVGAGAGVARRHVAEAGGWPKLQRPVHGSHGAPLRSAYTQAHAHVVQARSRKPPSPSRNLLLPASLSLPPGRLQTLPLDGTLAGCAVRRAGVVRVGDVAAAPDFNTELEVGGRGQGGAGGVGRGCWGRDAGLGEGREGKRAEWTEGSGRDRRREDHGCSDEFTRLIAGDGTHPLVLGTYEAPQLLHPRYPPLSFLSLRSCRQATPANP